MKATEYSQMLLEYNYCTRTRNLINYYIQEHVPPVCDFLYSSALLADLTLIIIGCIIH